MEIHLNIHIIFLINNNFYHHRMNFIDHNHNERIIKGKNRFFVFFYCQLIVVFFERTVIHDDNHRNAQE